MLIEFSVSNYRSILEKQTLSMVASNKDKELPGNCVALDAAGAGRIKLLKSAVIYGANASGKTNLFRALSFMVSFVRRSATDVKPGEKTGFEPLRLSSKSVKEPGTFGIVFAHDRVRYEYGFSLTADRVVEEHLVAYPKGHPQRWFSRTFNEKHGKYSWSFSRENLKVDASLRDKTRDNALFLSVAAQFNQEQLMRIYLWLFFIGLIDAPADGQFSTFATEFAIKTSEDRRKRITESIRRADLGISDIRVELIGKRTWDEIRFGLLADTEKTTKEGVNGELLKTEIIHTAADTGEPVAFPLENESAGSIRMFFLLGAWCAALESGNLVTVDEIDSSMHPLLVRMLVEMFHKPETNPKGAQLICTTHDTTLLDNSLFRRDQIWFTEKSNQGSTQLYPLTDYQPRNTEALQKGYLAGRYGAVPFLKGGLKF